MGLQPMVLFVLFLCGGIATCIEAFSSYRRGFVEAKFGQGLGSVKTSFQLRDSGVDLSNTASDFSSVLSAFVATYPGSKDVIQRLLSKLPDAAVVIPIIDNYVSRPVLEDEILQVYNLRREDSFGAYTIIVGPKGAGKSFATAHVLQLKPGVVYLRISQAETPLSLVRKLLKACGVNVDDNFEIGVDVLNALLVQVAKKAGGRPITIVFEVERALGASSDEVLYMIDSAAKELALSANVIIVVSEANDALALGDDPRQHFIWIDGMTHGEATACAKKMYPDVADHDLELFFDKVRSLLSVLLSPWRPLYHLHELHCVLQATR